MSWWITTTDPRGRKYLWSIGVGDLLPLMVILGLLAALVGPNLIKLASSRKALLSSDRTQVIDPKLFGLDNLH